MSPAPAKGILVLPFSTLKAASPVLGHPSKWHGVVTLTPEEFTCAFVNTFSPEDAAAAYERYAVPETGQIFYEGGFANFHLHPPTDVDFKNADRAPLLLVGASEDHTVPASVTKAAYKRYEKSTAKTDYIEFEGRPHLHMAAPDWEEVAEGIDACSAAFSTCRLPPERRCRRPELASAGAGLPARLSASSSRVRSREDMLRDANTRVIVAGTTSTGRAVWTLDDAEADLTGELRCSPGPALRNHPEPRRRVVSMRVRTP